MTVAVIQPGAVPYGRRAELILGDPDQEGCRVVKDPEAGEFYRLGPEESFLLEQLDGTRAAPVIRTAYEQLFGHPLSPEELEQFIEEARSHGLLRPVEATAAPAPPPAPVPVETPTGPRQSLFRLRLKLFNPDRLLAWLCPLVAFVWTWPFAVLSLGLAVVAGVVAWANAGALLGQLSQSLSWHTLGLVWVVLLVVTLVHEFAHGLACKRFGGEVREIGVLLIFFLPGMYCDVSDAWLFGSRWKRLLVTLAGAWCDLIVWSLAVLGWRMTEPGTLVNRVLWVTLSLLGARMLMNFNPLIRLDGYYLLSDAVGVPNLQQRSLAYLSAVLRWVLGGAQRPGPEPRPALLLGYGLASWVFGVVVLGLILGTLMQWIGERWGGVGSLAVLVLGFLLLYNLTSGLGPEVEEMVRLRQARAVVWLAALSAALGYVALGTRDDRAAGVFRLRSVMRGEARAGVPGFLDEVLAREGQRVEQGEVLARLRIPHLDTRLEQNRAEQREAEARLALLRAGSRPEEREEHRQRARRAEQTLNRARRDLERARQGLGEERLALESQLEMARVESANAAHRLQGARRLRATGAMAEDTYRDLQARVEVASAAVIRQQALLRNRSTIGTRDAELEVARRERELADARAALRLVEVEARAEEVAAEKARHARIVEEGRNLRRIDAQRVIVAARAGLITTPHLEDQQGKYVREGELICTVEEPGELEAEVLLSDQEVSRVAAGQAVELRPRDHPRVSLYATVERVGPSASRPPGGDPAATSSAVTAYCRVEEAPEGVRPGALGHARISRGRRPIRDILYDRALQLLRAEFWW